ncbi:hypothetical protein NG796_16735 [Laspinema sp. A4]|uniref:hypothetical protein n=1 Tax=Laspinema sp. D2d TaxID=2953686 RepID=UPI0021BA87DF|nr:hypothetical protein [Laspinema sp. D2d]MCT7984919.1 hypothetical protein [Laspinema sp. D2d]
MAGPWVQQLLNSVMAIACANPSESSETQRDRVGPSEAKTPYLQGFQLGTG